MSGYRDKHVCVGCQMQATLYIAVDGFVFSCCFDF